MKKIILFTMLCLPLFNFAQTKTQHSPEKLKLKELEIKRKTDALNQKSANLPINNAVFDKNTSNNRIVVGSNEYNLAKTEGKLSHYEVVLNEGKVISFEKTNYNLAGKVTSSTLTPCDIVPPGTISSFGAPLDDQTTPLISLPFTFCFYGNNYTQVRMSSNGNIQFPPTNNAAFSSTGFPAPNDIMIAPFWADLDNRGTGTFSYDIFPTYAVFTWGSVGYFNSKSDKLNDFQMVITDGLDPILPPGKNVGFYYNIMQWTTGDASSGVNGFPNPAITPAIPATVGANAGNGIDYFLIGRFGQAGSFYDGPLGVDDGVSWLNGKVFYFNACPPTGVNNEPIPTLIGYCDTLKVCGNDTLVVKNTFIAPEVSQTVTVTAVAPTLGSAFSYSVLPNTNSTDIYMIVDGSIATGGYHMVTMTATDNGVPSQTSVQNFIVYVNQAAINNLNGSIVLTPTLGACPGQTISASVTVSGGVPDSYLWSNNATTATTTFTTIVAADSLIFVTLQSGQCQKTIVGDININPVPVASISGNLSFCNGNASSTVLTATNTLNPSTQGPHTYNWSGTGTLSATNTSSTSVNGGAYTVTVTNQFGCISVATTTVVMYETPTYTLTSANAISGGSVYCVNQDTARISISFGGGAPASCGLATTPCIISNTVQVGTATTQGSVSDYTPFNGLWESAKHQYLIRASELLAAGVTPGKLSSLSLGVTNLNGNASTFENFSIKLKCVSNNVVGATMDNIGLVQVYGPLTITANVGLNTYNFTQGYEWDGTNNLLVDICWFNPNWDGNLSVQYSNVGFNASLNKDADGIDQCPLGTVDATSQLRPNMIFGNCLSQQVGSQFNIVVTPSVGVVIPAANDSIKFALPSAAGTTCYTVSLVNLTGGCSKDTVICVEALQGITQGTLSVTNTSVCPSATVTVSALGTLTSYTIQYIDNAGIQTSTTSPVTFAAPAIVGAYTYTLLATGPCGGTLTAFTNTLNVIQGITNATLVATPSVVCIGSPVTLSSVGSISNYTISYNNGAGVINSINSPATFNTAVNGTNNFTLQAQGFCSAPTNTYNTAVSVNNLINLTITPMANVVKCLNSSVSLTANVASSAAEPYTYNWTPAAGTNTNSTFVTSTPVTTTFVVTVNGVCANTATATVVVSNFATDVNVSIIDSASVCASTELILSTVTSGGKSPYSYNWTLLPDINSISNASTLNSIAPGSAGAYTVMVVSTDSCGFTDFDTQLINVLPPCDIVVPNIITPNSDGANDFFKIKNIEYHPNSTLSIFDRWGKKVYSSSNYANEWKGDGLNDGTFFYILEVPDDKKYNGFVQLLR